MAKDLPKIFKLAQAYWKFEKLPGFSPNAYKKLVTKILKTPALGKIWVAVERDQLIGYLVVVFLMSLEYGGISSEVDELYVESSKRGRGVGEALLTAAWQKMYEKRVVRISLRVGKSNKKGIRFYRKIGFLERNEFLVMDRKR